MHTHDYTNTTQYELSLPHNLMLSMNNKQSQSHEEMLFKNNKHIFLEICQIQAESFYMLAQKQDHEIFTIIMKDIEKALKSKLYVDSQSFVLEEYHDLIDVFERQNADKLPPHQEEYNIEIDLKSKKTSNFRSLYSMS